ncbi:PIN domain-containing protein [Klebsiella aerogenes]|uniref:PIN domain-containing protein n=1 Tax=Klebsiella aerogenes TaxID=548 RepID=UPI00300D0795
MAAQLEYGAISIDSNIMHSLGYKFDAGVLDQLKQFKNKHVVVVQPRIIHNEMVRHLSEPFDKLHAEIDKVRKESVRKLKVTEKIALAAAEQLKGELNSIELAEKIISDFYEDVNGIILDTKEYLDADELINLYFHTEPPFENNKDKKNEFPDAIALLCLDAWAHNQNFKVVAVSNDKGWKNFSEGAANIEVVDDLPSALTIFQPHQRAIEIIDSLLGNEFLDEGKRLFIEIREWVAGLVTDDVNLTVEASSSFMFDYDDITVEFGDMKILQKQGKNDPVDLIRIDENVIVLSINVEVQCYVEANFNYFITDSLDKDDVMIGASTEKASENFNTLLLVTLAGDFAKSVDDIELVEVQMQNNIDSVDFGSVQPYFEPEPDDQFDYYAPVDNVPGEADEF